MTDADGNATVYNMKEENEDDRNNPSEPKFIEELFLQNNLLSVDSLRALANYLPMTNIYYLHLSYNRQIKPEDISRYLYPILPKTYVFHLYYYNKDNVQDCQPSTDLLDVFRENEERWKEETAAVCRVVCCFLRCQSKFLRTL